MAFKFNTRLCSKYSIVLTSKGKALVQVQVQVLVHPFDSIQFKKKRKEKKGREEMLV